MLGTEQTSQCTRAGELPPALGAAAMFHLGLPAFPSLTGRTPCFHARVSAGAGPALVECSPLRAAFREGQGHSQAFLLWPTQRGCGQVQLSAQVSGWAQK